jgi:hypothetical protein
MIHDTILQFNNTDHMEGEIILITNKTMNMEVALTLLCKVNYKSSYKN